MCIHVRDGRKRERLIVVICMPAACLPSSLSLSGFSLQHIYKLCNDSLATFNLGSVGSLDFNLDTDLESGIVGKPESSGSTVLRVYDNSLTFKSPTYIRRRETSLCRFR